MFTVKQVFAFVLWFQQTLCLFPFQNISLSWDERVEDLVSRLTLEEMMDQMAKGRADTTTGTPPIPRLGIGQFDWANECLHGVAKAGKATSFPQAIGLAATWSKDIVYRVAMATSMELRAKNNNYTRHGSYGFHQGLTCFSPVVNILRDPRWGRSQETYGEDPYLTSVLASNFVQGLQGGHPRYARATAGCKHFGAYAGPEDIPESRLSFDAVVDERDLRTTFFPAFRSCVKSGTYSIMCSYNSVNGVPSCANRDLLTDVLRNEWNFTGYVVSDAGAIEYVWHDHNYTNNNVDTVAACVNAGCNLNLAAGNWSNFTNAFYSMVDAVKLGKINKRTVIERMKPLWYTRMRLGEFDPPELNPYRSIDLSIIQSQDHQDLSLEAAMKSILLLKNRNKTLPLSKERYQWIAIVGPMIDNPTQLFGDYSAVYDPQYTVTAYNGLESLGGNITSGQGCADNRCTRYTYNDVASAVHDAEIVFVCLGLGIQVESEGKDRSNISLPGQQLQLLKDVIRYSPKEAKIILTVFNAGSVDLSWAESNDRISAILAAFYPGQTAGTALRKIIINDGPFSVPAARTPYTWPLSKDQLPPMVNYSMDGRTYRYLRADQQPLYPFGYGLSYTEFWYQDLHIDLPRVGSLYVLDAGVDLLGSVSVLNIGDYDADEVIQVYIKWINGNVTTPNIQLVDFARLHVTSKGRINFSFRVMHENMAVWLNNKGWSVEPGIINVYVGGQQPFQQKNVGSNILDATVLIRGSKLLGKY